MVSGSDGEMEIEKRASTRKVLKSGACSIDRVLRLIEHATIELASDCTATHRVDDAGATIRWRNETMTFDKIYCHAHGFRPLSVSSAIRRHTEIVFTVGYKCIGYSWNPV